MGVLVLIVCLLCGASSAMAAPGERNGGFGRKGIVKVDADPAASNVEDRVEVDGAGRYVVLATTDAGGSRVLRFLPDGTIDGGFGSGGSVAAPEGTWHDLALLPDGRIVLAGSRNRDFAVAALGPDGALDSSFGQAGVATVHVEPGGPLASDRHIEEGFERVRLDAAGRIVAVGDAAACTEEPEVEPEYRCFHQGSAVARFTPSGEPDPGFGGDGIVFFDPLVDGNGSYGVGNLSTLTPQPDGRILVGGNIADDLLVARLTADGSLDPTFSGNGIVRSRADTAVSEGELFHAGAAHAVLVQRSGRIIAVGGEVMVAFKPNGREDRSFGPHRKGVAEVESPYTTNLGFEPTEGALDAKGRIVLAGKSWNLTSVSRFYPNGVHDPRYAGDGLAHVNLSKTYIDSSTPEELATDLALAPNGAATTAGFAYVNEKRAQLALSRFTGGDGHRATCEGKPAAVQGTPGDDRLSALGPIVGFGGDDEIDAGYGPICAGTGDDEVRDGYAGTIYGGPGDDRITRYGSSPVYGGRGNDVILAHKGAEDLNVFFGGFGADLLVGGRGPDRLFGGPGPDRLLGGPGDDRLFGGPGKDEESGAGGGGRKAVYSARGHDGFRIRLVVRKHRITGVHLHVRLHCSDGHSYDSWWNTNRLGAKIHPNGRFRHTTSIDTSDEWSESVLAGRVTRERIVATYAEKGRGESYCRTGSRKHPEIRFVARRGRG